MRRRGVANLGDRVFRLVTGTFAATAVAALAVLALQMARASRPALHAFGLRFLTGRDWDPVQDAFGALPFVYGTLASALLALAVAVPVGLGVAVFLSEMAPGWLRRPLGLLVELLAAVPSVIYGLWGIFVLVPWLRESLQPWLADHLGWIPLFRGTPRGFGLMAGALVLAIMVLPTLASVGRDVLRAVPVPAREGALALGATRWEAIVGVVLPMARGGVVGAVILALGRALGETMAVTMLIGNRAEISLSLLDPSHTLASVIANEYAEASGDLHLAALTELGLVLFGVTLLLNLAARWLIHRVGRGPGGEVRP